MRRILSISLALLAFVNLLGRSQAAETGGLEGHFLNWGAGARALGLGKAYSAVVDDASATYWNPAGLARLQRSELNGLHAQLWEGVTFDFASFAFPTLVHGTFGLHAVVLAVGGVERRDAENTLLAGTFGEIKAAIGPSWAFQLSPWLSAGVTAKYVGRWLDGINTGFITGDLGLLAVLPEGITIAATAKQLAAVKLGNTADALPFQGRIGAAWRPFLSGLLISADLEQTGQLHIGMELAPLSPIFLRAGTDRLETAVGGGIKFEDMGLDYTASLHQELGLSHRMSFSLQFGEPMPLLRLSQAKMKFEGAYALYDKLSQESQGGQINQEGKEECVRLLTEILALDPTNGSAEFLRAKLNGETVQKSWQRK